MDQRIGNLPPDGGELTAENGSLRLPIGEVSRIVGVSPQTLRAWESEGLVKPSRSGGGTRYYSSEDLERLRRIKHLRTVDGLNFAAIRRELGSAEGSPSGDGSEREQLARKVGKRLRQLRVRRRKTLKEVSEATGLSVSFLSALERGSSGASIASLRAVMKAYGANWREVFDVEPKERSRLVRPDGRPAMQWPNGVRSEDLATTGSLMDPTTMYLPPHTGSGEHFSHTGEEFIYVLSGILFVDLKDENRETYRLASKDSLYFPSSIPHTWWTEDEEAEVIYVNSPPSF
ncbi:MAG: MerR family transcriptional regulator [Rubrobacteraceae bacterium]